ncbi:MAG: cupin domain-containing protein [candidate division Zixibacteria bacterium]|nr:cupin domain-containing protein [candidate division Zixibacteria bacterium]
MSFEYPEFIKSFPEADIPLDGVKGYLVPGDRGLVVFLEIEPIGKIPPHSHGAQWGTVISGEMKLTIGDETRTYGPGDNYYIPAGEVHSAEFLTKFYVVDVFEERDRYKVKQK